MNLKERIETVVEASGLWRGERRQSHSFLLSPEVYKVSAEELKQLEVLGRCLQEVLAGFGRIMGRAFEKRFEGDHLWGRIRKSVFAGMPHFYKPYIETRSEEIPLIVKVDLMKDRQGRLWISEIDGTNKHGLGYSTLCRRIWQTLYPNAQGFPGVATQIANLAKERFKAQDLLLVYLWVERFYQPEFQILAQELKSQGVEMGVYNELELKAEMVRKFRLFVDLPPLLLFQKKEIRLRELYNAQRIHFLIPPKPFFGSKAMLALLSNALEDKAIEELLLSEIPLPALTSLRQYIPKTYWLVVGGRRKHTRSKRKKVKLLIQSLQSQHPIVLKPTALSGMKGVAFSDEPGFEEVVEKAVHSPRSYIVQEEVEHQPFDLRYFDEEGRERQGRWYLRITAHFSLGKVADLVVTARPDRRVHGAKDSLQFGSIIE